MTLDWLDILTTILGLIYIWLEYRAHIALWVVGIIMPALDVILYWNHGLYGDAGMACYYTLAAVYGLIMWSLSPNPSPSREGSGEHEVSSTVSELPITHSSLRRGVLPTTYSSRGPTLPFPYSTPSPMPCRLSVCGRWHANISSSGSSGLLLMWSAVCSTYRKAFPSKPVSTHSMSSLL